MTWPTPLRPERGVRVGFLLCYGHMAPFSKPFALLTDQIALLKGRGMHFPDEAKAERCLARVSYYRLSAYWYPFREHVAGARSDNFVKDTVFDEVFDFYVFDKSLRLLAWDALERIEVALRAQIADLLAVRDPCAHRLASEVHGNFAKKPSPRDPSVTMHQDWLNGQDRTFSRSREDFATHFRSKYTGHPPIWIAKEVWDWGTLSHFYNGLKDKDKDAVSALYGSVTGKEMVTWVRALNDVRNICAHHSRLWNRGLTVTLKMPNMGVFPALDHLKGDPRGLSRSYGVFTIMALMMKAIHPSTEWHIRVRELVDKAPKNPLIDLATAGFPLNWQTQTIWGK